MEKAVPKNENSDEKAVKDPFKTLEEEESTEIEPENLIKWPSKNEEQTVKLPVPKRNFQRLKNRLFST